MSRSKVLIATNHLRCWSGSELVTLELAEAFRDLGWEATICCNFFSEDDAGAAAAEAAFVCDDPGVINAFEYDFVWAQHTVAPLLRYEMSVDARPATYFAFAHLSPFEPFEMIYAPLEDVIADVILFNSEETRFAMAEHGADLARGRVFFNAAPHGFWIEDNTPHDALRSVLMVSNHPASEEVAAMTLLGAAGIKVNMLGMSHDYRRIKPTDISEADAILTIGKTVPMAIASRRPVFIYDRFGGPGYLDAGNFDRARDFNFSGRCTRTQMTGEAIARAILAGFPAASAFMSELGEEQRSRFRLRNLLTDLIAAPRVSNVDRLRRMDGSSTLLANGRASATLIRRYYREFATSGKRILY